MRHEQLGCNDHMLLHQAPYPLPPLRGQPDTIVSDNGTALTATAVLHPCQQTGMEWHSIAPGKAYAERLR